MLGIIYCTDSHPIGKVGLKHRLGVRPEDVLINLVEVKKENWSFGNGIAQYAD